MLLVQRLAECLGLIFKGGRVAKNSFILKVVKQGNSTVSDDVCFRSLMCFKNSLLGGCFKMRTSQNHHKESWKLECIFFLGFNPSMAVNHLSPVLHHLLPPLRLEVLRRNRGGSFNLLLSPFNVPLWTQLDLGGLSGLQSFEAWESINEQMNKWT